MTSNPRLEQFKKMATDDPTNDLAHFSLGWEYLQGGDAEQAVASFQRVLELKPNMSKAYQLLGSALLKQEKKGAAIERLTQGVRIAHDRGDVMPKNEMIKMLRELGAAIPELGEARVVEVGEGQVVCKRCGRVAKKIPAPPFRNEFGKQIFENTCADCWREAIGHGTKVINELRLPLADPQAQKVWDQQIKEFLNLT